MDLLAQEEGQILALMTALVHGLSARAQNAQAQSSEGGTPASEESRIYETVVVTASARNERLGDTAATVQILGREEIEQTSATISCHTITTSPRRALLVSALLRRTRSPNESGW